MKKFINLSIILVLLLGFFPQATATAQVVPLWQQLPNGEGATESVLSGTLHADNFYLSEASLIGGIEIWSNDAGPYYLTFDIYLDTTDEGGYHIPGGLYHREVISSASGVEDEICPKNGDYYYCKYRYTLSLDSPLELTGGNYWLSVYGSAGSYFGWSPADIPSQLPTYAFKHLDNPWNGQYTGNAFAFRLLAPQQTCPSSVVVTSLLDSGGAGTLRQALVDVCPNGTITFDTSLSGQTITLTSELTLDKNVTIDGSALTSKVSISGNNLFQVFSITPLTTVTMDSLIITNGWPQDSSSNGGGINNQGNLTLSNSTLVNNHAVFGGGIYSAGTLSLINSSLLQNSATVSGGTLLNSGSATLTGCTISNNESATGGGIDIGPGGMLTVIDSTFTGNNASTQGGGINIAGSGEVQVFGSTFINNSAGSAGGGGINNWGTTSVINSTFTGNVSATGYGSAINNLAGNLTLYNSTLSGNTGLVTLNNEEASMFLANTIIANTINGNDCDNYNGTIGTNTNNLVEDGSCSAGAVNYLSGDPMLDILADNGGPTQTMTLLAGSPAIDAGDDTICAAPPVDEVDQRGVTRPQGAACDIGAFELEQTSDTGSLKISKDFDPLTSGFTGDFTIFYSCGEENWAYITLGADEDITVYDIPIGSQCTVSETTLPTPATGWSFGTPTFNPETGIVTISETLAEVTVTNTISQNAPEVGELKISKVFEPLTSGFTGTFAIDYDCDDGETHDGAVYLAAGTSQTISGIPTGTSCTVTESSLPVAPTGWSFGTPTFNPEGGLITVSEVSPAYAEVIVTNTISRDLGDLKISKVFDPLTSCFTGTFAINYDCNDGSAHDGTANLAAGTSQTISGIPTGTECVITEPALPTAPTGWSFGTPTYNPADGTVTISKTLAEVIVTNTISQLPPETGELKISKVFNPLTSGFTGTFAIDYDCNDGTTHDGTVHLVGGTSQTINGIPIGTLCTVTEATLPTSPSGWTFGTPTYSPENGFVTIGETLIEVTVTNVISEGFELSYKIFLPLINR